MKEIDRRLFLSLHRDNKYHHHYYVLLDGNYNNDFWADDDSDAIRIFRNGEYEK